MKRDPILANLSREHHTSLLLAQLLKKGAAPYKGMPANVHDKFLYAKKLYEDSIRQHFEKEEKMLDQLLPEHAELIEICKEILDEHQQLQLLFTSLQENKQLEMDLDAIGHLLELHIRKEERVLFPLMQLHCSDTELKQVEALLLK